MSNRIILSLISFIFLTQFACAQKSKLIEEVSFISKCSQKFSNSGCIELWAQLGDTAVPFHESSNSFSMANVLYYFGALIVIGAMGFFMVFLFSFSFNIRTLVGSVLEDLVFS